MPRNSVSLFLVIFLVFTCNLALAQEEFVYDSKGKRNPFMPLVTNEGVLIKFDSPKNSMGLYLEGIIFDDKGVSYAIVNKSVVMVGDRVDDYQVLKIEREKVTFMKDGEPLEITLKKEEEKE